MATFDDANAPAAAADIARTPPHPTDLAPVVLAEPWTMERLETLGLRAKGTLAKVRRKIMAPYPQKAEPMVTSSVLTDVCRIDRQRLAYLLKTDESGLPKGQGAGPRLAREFTVSEVGVWARALRKGPKRPGHARGRILGVANYKGGSAKTTTAVPLAQGLALRGHKVLLVDLDPQGSATALMGRSPETDVDSMTETCLRLFYPDDSGERPTTLDGAVTRTYWPDLDLIAGGSSLFEAEFVIPAALRDGTKRDFWAWLAPALQHTARDYDFIIVDTPPSLSYLTINALYAVDAVLMPLPPESLDFASSVQFWSLIPGTFQDLEQYGLQKAYDFVNVLLVRTRTTPTATAIRSWILDAYGDALLPIEIPDSAAVRDASIALSTIYETRRPTNSREAYDRVRVPFDALVDMLEEKLSLAWMYAGTDTTPAPEAAKETT